MASFRRATALEEQAKAREAALRAEHAAEVALLVDALRHQHETHAAEIEGLRAEHAVVLRRLVEAQHHRVLGADRRGTPYRPGRENGPNFRPDCPRGGR